MIRMTFRVKQHEEYDMLGLWPEGRHWADPGVSGMIVAHDMLEHFPRDGGSVEGEIMALGAALYVRDGDSYFSACGSRHGYVVNVGSEAYSLNDYMQAGRRSLLQDLPKDRPLWDKDIEQQLVACSNEFRRVLEVEQAEDTAWADGPNVLGWLRRGYRRAAKRYHGISSFWMMEAFRLLEKEADRLLGYAQEQERYRISINPKRQLIVINELGYPNNY